MGHADPFLLGPLGAMTRLPGVPVGSGVDVNIDRLAGQQSSLRGRLTTDVWSSRRVLTFTWPMARAADASRLASRWRGTSRRPWRLLDPFTPNLLTYDASVAGAEQRLEATAGDPESWAVPTIGGGLLEPLTAGDEPPGVADWVDVDLVSRYAVTGSSGAYALTAASQAFSRVPILGRALTFSAWVRGTGSVNLRVIPASTSGVFGAPVNGPTVALTSTWQRMVMTVPAGRTEPSAAVALVGTPTFDYQTTGWQVEHGTVATPWAPGGGAPEVELTAFGDGYRRLGYRAVDLTLREV